MKILNKSQVSMAAMPEILPPYASGIARRAGKMDKALRHALRGPLQAAGSYPEPQETGNPTPRKKPTLRLLVQGFGFWDSEVGSQGGPSQSELGS